MLTCKVGNTTINCFDGKYDKFTLKRWSDENRLICPDCGGVYEYCHGEIVHPYFRHKEKNKCENIYYEPETEEHIQGKIILYNWLSKMQKDNRIENLKLEAYIPETRQRPDLYFTADGKRYVIEFQCSPIATKFLERHRLYQLAGIYDIWILGTKKYTGRFKTIQNFSDFYLNVDSKKMRFSSEIIEKFLPYKLMDLRYWYSYEIDNFIFDTNSNSISLKNHIVEQFIKQDEDAYKKHNEFLRCRNKLEQTIEKLKQTYDVFEFELTEGNHNFYYLWAIKITNNFGSCRFFIKDNCTDLCSMYKLSKTFLGKDRYKLLDRFSYDFLNIDEISEFLVKSVSKIDEYFKKYHKDKGDSFSFATDIKDFFKEGANFG